jgi:hypothetical protein
MEREDCWLWKSTYAWQCQQLAEDWQEGGENFNTGGWQQLWWWHESVQAVNAKLVESSIQVLGHGQKINVRRNLFVSCQQSLSSPLVVVLYTNTTLAVQIYSIHYPFPAVLYYTSFLPSFLTSSELASLHISAPS